MPSQLIATLALAGFVVAAAAQQRPAAPVAFEPVVFSPGRPVTDYIGNNPAKVYRWVADQIAAVPWNIDQFSSADDRARYRQAVIDRMNAIGKIPFVADCQKQYDVDRQAFNVKALVSSFKGAVHAELDAEALHLRKLTVETTNQVRDTYVGRNAYGATFDVSRTQYEEYVLSFPAGPSTEPASAVVPGGTVGGSRTYRYSFGYLVLSARLPPAEARSENPNIACLYVFTPVVPFMFDFREFELPTASMPFEHRIKGHALYGKLDQFAVFNKVTGVLYDQASRAKD